jgi:hypothetical protein
MVQGLQEIGYRNNLDETAIKKKLDWLEGESKLMKLDFLGLQGRSQTSDDRL